ncbi:hypothetical protein MOQ_006736, partial [Trypanosoma cruzi marinkellei]
MSPWLSAGTHSPHTPLQPRVVYASADAASSSGAHTHAELLRLPSISRGRDGARVVVVVGASVVVVLGASGAVVVVVVVVVGAFVVVVVVFDASICFSCSFSDWFCPLCAPNVTVDVGFTGGTPGTSGPASPDAPDATWLLGVPPVGKSFVFSVPLATPCFSTLFPRSPSFSPGSCNNNVFETGESVRGSSLTSLAVAHTHRQQHRASTNRAHSRRHVIIIVTVVVQWCGADLHSEGHGEQQGRREVRQTHTHRESKPHEERAAGPTAHHARHTLQSTATGTHTYAALSQQQHTDG